MATSPLLILSSISLSSLVSLLLLAPLGCQEEVHPVAPEDSSDETQQRGGGTSDAAGGGGWRQAPQSGGDRDHGHHLADLQDTGRTAG